MNVDLDSVVNVKLTEEGKKLVLNFYIEMFYYSPFNPKEELALKRNINGTYKFTFVEFMQIFGGYGSNIKNYFESIDIISKKRNSHIRILK